MTATFQKYFPPMPALNPWVMVASRILVLILLTEGTLAYLEPLV